MAASVAQIKHKRQREILTEYHSGEFEDDQNLHKRSRNGLLPDLFSTDDADGDDVEEINGTSDMGENSGLTGEIEERVSSYEDLVNATDEQLGICRSLPLSGEENDNEGISNKFWSDLFENSSYSKGQNVDVLHPFLSHCCSYNYRDYVEYNTLLLSEDQQEWIRKAFMDLASQRFLTLS